MAITGYYDGTAVQVDVPLHINQKVIIIPIDNGSDLEESAAGGLHNYADVTLIKQEKDAWRKTAIRRHVE